MFRTWLAIAVIVALAAFGGASQAERTLSNESFNLQVGDEGITSLKRPNDVYDTDYIADGASLGGLVVRYRRPPDTEWRTADIVMVKEATAASLAGTGVSYVVGELTPTIASVSKVTASAGNRGLNSVHDQVEPGNSGDWQATAFVWRTSEGGPQWLQYDFAKPETVSFVSIYWFEMEFGRYATKTPKSWRLLYKDGEEWKEVSNPSSYGVEKDKFNRVTFDPVLTSGLRAEVQFQEGASAGVLEWRVNTDEGRSVKTLTELGLTGRFTLEGDALVWSIELENLSDQQIEVGDLGLPLQFNTRYSWNKIETYTKRVLRHSFVSGHGSFVYWMRTNGEGPYLVMVPTGKTKLEYFGPAHFRGYCPYIYSRVAAAEAREMGGTWRQPNTSLTLAPKGSKSDSADYGFRFRWAADYDGVRDVLYEEGGFDTNVVPGMTVPDDLFALFSLRTKEAVTSVDPEYPDETQVEYIGEKAKDTHVYKVKFSRLGENLLTVKYGDDKHLILEFFVTEPLETLVKKRASFLVNKQQHRDPSKWYNGLICDWDMKNKVLRNPEDNTDGFDGWWNYVLTCDDPGLCKVPYVASKNVSFPDQREIEAVEYYLKNYVWGGLQCKTDEKYPYAIYGVPNWKVNRDSTDPGPNGKDHLWRIYDYPHIVLLYYRMYQIAKLYPDMTKYLDASGYLERAQGTAIAFFTVPMAIRGWSAYHTGTYDELIIPDVIKALYAEGMSEKGDELKKQWEKKVDHFINEDPYLYGSEYSFDSTGFESTHVFAKYAMGELSEPNRTLQVTADGVMEFMKKEIGLNLVCRGWLETAYYFLGSDYRGDSSRYTLTYMAQMGGWSIVDYALYYAKDPIRYMRLGYASYLSSWALMNTGTPESNYGYWYPGVENDGGAGGGFEPSSFTTSWLRKEQPRGSWFYGCEIDLGFGGAIRTAATIVAEDPIFGLFAYGALLTEKGAVTEVIPKDGLRHRFHLIRGKQRLHTELERDGFAADKPISFNDDLSEIRFTVENRTGDKHGTRLSMSGLPAGSYEVTMNDLTLQTIQSPTDEEAGVVLPVEKDKPNEVRIAKIKG